MFLYNNRENGAKYKYLTDTKTYTHRNLVFEEGDTLRPPVKTGPAVHFKMAQPADGRLQPPCRRSRLPTSTALLRTSMETRDSFQPCSALPLQGPRDERTAMPPGHKLGQHAAGDAVA